MCAAGELRGAPASTTTTLRLARDSTKGGTQARGAAADHHYVKFATARVVVVHVFRVAATPCSDNSCCFSKTNVSDMGHTTSPGVSAFIGRA